MSAKKTAKTKKPAPAKKPAKPRSKKDLRSTINVSAIIDALEQHILGNKKMTSTQVAAALALLKKTLPDAAAQTAPRSDSAKQDIRAHEDALGALE